MRVATYSSESLDPFADSDTRGSPHVRLGFYPYARGRFSAGLLADYVYSQTSSTFRGLASELVTHRTGLGLEGRYHLDHRVSLYGRIVAGAAVSRALLKPVGEQEFRADSADFRLDGAAGVQARIAGPSDGRQLDFRLSVFLEGGFDYSAAWDAELRSVAEDIFRDQPISVGGLDSSAPYVATGLLLSY